MLPTLVSSHAVGKKRYKYPRLPLLAYIMQKKLYDTFVPLPPRQKRSHPEAFSDAVLDLSPKKHAYTQTVDLPSLLETDIEVHQTQRRLSKRMIYLIAFSGVIGTAVFVSMGLALHKAGPFSLLLGFAIWCLPILCITASIGEMVCYLPIPSPFISMAGRCCDEALEITAGWNFWFLQAALIPYEVVGVNTIIHYWRDDYSPAIPLVIQIVLYFFINVVAVEIYGEAEFWLSIGKVILAVGIMLYTFVTMVGGNPLHDRYGFRYYHQKPMAEFIDTGDWGRFLGLFAAISTACFTIAGPEYVAMTAAETKNPRVVLPKAFRTMFFRLSFLFLGLSLCMGIVCSYNDPLLVEALKTGLPGAAASPFVISMVNLKIRVLPDIVNGALVIAAFSSGNSYTYTSLRTLYGLAKRGHAPTIFAYCTRSGTPMYAILALLAWSFLSFLQLGENSADVLSYIVSLVTISQLSNYVICCITYYFFYKALIAQNIDRHSLPYRGYFQPYLSWIGGTCAFVMCFLSGYGVFLKGAWDTKTFIFNYIMIPIDILIYVVAKLWTRKGWKSSKDADLITGLKEIEDEEAQAFPDEKNDIKGFFGLFKKDGGAVFS